MAPLGALVRTESSGLHTGNRRISVSAILCDLSVFQASHPRRRAMLSVSHVDTDLRGVRFLWAFGLSVVLLE